MHNDTGLAYITDTFKKDDRDYRAFQTGHKSLAVRTSRDEFIIKDAIQLECSNEAVNKLVLYRGSLFSNDSLMRKECANSLSYGNSLFAGALYDVGATAYHYMRKLNLNAQAYFVPLESHERKDTPFHVNHVHPLKLLMSKGEIFHARTKIWKMEPEKQIWGFLGLNSISYDQIKELCKTPCNQEEMVKNFKEYRAKAYFLGINTAAY